MIINTKDYYSENTEKSQVSQKIKKFQKRVDFLEYVHYNRFCC